MSYLLIATLLAQFGQPYPGTKTRMIPAARRLEPEPLSTLKFLRSLVLLVWISATVDLKNSSRQTEIPF